MSTLIFGGLYSFLVFWGKGYRHRHRQIIENNRPIADDTKNADSSAADADDD